TRLSIFPVIEMQEAGILEVLWVVQTFLKELVRPLRDAGWQVQMGEPDEKGLWVKVEATSGEERLNVGLIFSCASENRLYRELAADCSAILYLGPPYKQQSYAYGIDVHVGPVAGWRPPTPQGSTRAP
ncbi:hypothetical protein, partial [Xanthomonas oryzae]